MLAYRIQGEVAYIEPQNPILLPEFEDGNIRIQMLCAAERMMTANKISTIIAVVEKFEGCIGDHKLLELYQAQGFHIVDHHLLIETEISLEKRQLISKIRRSNLYQRIIKDIQWVTYEPNKLEEFVRVFTEIFRTSLDREFAVHTEEENRSCLLQLISQEGFDPSGCLLLKYRGHRVGLLIIGDGDRGAHMHFVGVVRDFSNLALLAIGVKIYEFCQTKGYNIVTAGINIENRPSWMLLLRHGGTIEKHIFTLSKSLDDS